MRLWWAATDSSSVRAENVSSRATGEVAALSAIGAATALGGAVQAAAAARAGVARPSPIPGGLAVDSETNEPVPVTGLAAVGLTDGFEGMGRLARLGEAALLDLVSASPPISPSRTRMLLALPRPPGEGAEAHRGRGGRVLGEEDPEDEEEPEDPPGRKAEHLAREILDGANVPLLQTSVQCFLGERAGTTEALQHAMATLAQRQCDAVLLLALDSLADPSRLDALVAEGRVKTPDNPTGFLPGEAAVALLLERRDARSTRPPLALVGTPISTVEPVGPEGVSPAAGRRLHDLLAGLAAPMRVRAPGTIYLDLNGESNRAREWGNILVRARRTTRLDTWATELPATSFGETGAASPLLALLLAAQAFSRQPRAAEVALVAIADDLGLRAAFGMVRGTDAGS